MELYWCLAFEFLVLLLVANGSSGNQYTIEWTPAGVASVGNEFTVDIGDTLILTCPPNSYSNLIGLTDERQYSSCNSTVTDATSEFRGSCLGFSTPTSLILNIEQASAKLPSDFGFIEGRVSYLTSFSSGANLSSAFEDRTAGGECSNGLQLALYIRDSSSTTEASTTTDTAEASTSSSIQTSTTIDPATSFSEPNFEGLKVFSGSTGQHRITTSTFTCTLLLFILRTIS